MNLTTAIAELRHAYKQLAGQTVKNQVAFAKRLLGPAIEALEKIDRAQGAKLYVLTVQHFEPCAGGPPCAPSGPDVYLYTNLGDAKLRIPTRNGDDNLVWREHDAHGKAWSASARRGATTLWYVVHETKVDR